MRRPRNRFRALFIVALSALIVSGSVFFHKQIQYRIWPKNFGEVVPGKLYRAADQYPDMYRKLCTEHGIRTILDLSGEDPEEDAVASELGIDRFQFSLVGDGTGDPALWAAALEVMTDPARQPVLVHCAAGAQRTTTAILLYRNEVEGESFREAYPESFDFRHKPDEWTLLAFLADEAPAIRAIRERGFAEVDGEAVPLDDYVRRGHSAGADPPSPAEPDG